MSLLRDAANFEDRRWRNRLSDWRRDAAVHHLRRVGQVFGGLSLLFLLVDGARRDASHGTATVSAFQPGAIVQTERGTRVPCFVGQAFSLGDSLLTDDTSSVTVAFPDGSVLQIPARSQVTLSQSDAFRNGRRFRYFTLLRGEALLYAPKEIETGFSLPGVPLQTRQGSFRFEEKLGAVVSASTAALGRFSVKPGALVGLERLLWLPGDFVLSHLGVGSLGTLSGTDAQRKEECRKVASQLQKRFRAQPPSAGAYSLDILNLEQEDSARARASVKGLLVEVRQGGRDFVAQLTARDSAATRFRITTNQIVEDKIK